MALIKFSRMLSFRLGLLEFRLELLLKLLELLDYNYY